MNFPSLWLTLISSFYLKICKTFCQWELNKEQFIHEIPGFSAHYAKSKTTEKF